MLSGDEHIGKGTLALYLACMLNCQEENAPCGSCSTCRRILKSSFADVRVLGALSTEDGTKTGVSTEQVKEILESSSLAPYEGLAKVYIIEGAENLSIAAANRLLKTLEEHEKYVYFVLLTENASAVLPTIASRLITIELKKASSEDIASFLTSIGTDFMLANDLAQMADGNTGWAVLASKDSDMVQKRKEYMAQAIALTKMSFSERLNLAGEICKGFSKDRQKLFRQLDVWQSVFRDILTYLLGQETLIVNKSLLPQIRELPSFLNAEKICALMRKLVETKRLLKQNVTPLLALEVMMFSLEERF